MFYFQGKAACALLTAAYRGYQDIVNTLIANGANVRAADDYGQTSLHLASSQGHLDIVKTLMANGMQVDVKTEDGCTPLYLAALDRHHEVARLLLDYGATMEPDIALMLGDIELVEQYIKKGIDVNSKLTKGYRKGQSWLMATVTNKNIVLATLLLDFGADVNEGMKPQNVTPLHRASALDFIEICSLLIARGADINAKSKTGQTPLHLAAIRTKALVELLLNSGANINALDVAGRTPIFEAARAHRQEIVECLLSRGAEVNLIDRDGFSPLLCAFQQSGGDDTIRTLVAYGADVNVRGARNRPSPLHIAVAQNNKNMVELLLARGAREGLY